MSLVQNVSTKNDLPVRGLPRACADEDAAVDFMEKHRWGDSPACPRCGDTDVRKMIGKNGKRERHYRWACRGCKQQFSVRTGTVFEDSRAKMKHWCYAFWRAATSKKGVSALEIHRQTGLSYKSSLFLLHRIRYAMSPVKPGPLTGIVEVDETFVGGKSNSKGRYKDKVPVMALVERGGKVKAMVIPNVTGATLKNAIRENVDRSARIMTDEHRGYIGIGKEFASHETVRHTYGEYARGDVTTNRAESFFGIMKRGLTGIYHAVSREHLNLYVSEYAWRHNNRALMDGDRTVAAIKASEGKHLRYDEHVK